MCRSAAPHPSAIAAAAASAVNSDKHFSFSWKNKANLLDERRDCVSGIAIHRDDNVDQARASRLAGNCRLIARIRPAASSFRAMV